MLKVNFLKNLAIVALAAPFALAENSARAKADDDADDSLVGLWEATITGTATYRYVYSISHGSYVATGNVDEGFMGFKFSPTMGTYIRASDGSYPYRERGYVFDMKGNNVGTFTTVGSLRLGADRKTFTGPGNYTQFDMHSKPVAKESFTIKAVRVSV